MFSTSSNQLYTTSSAVQKMFWAGQIRVYLVTYCRFDVRGAVLKTIILLEIMQINRLTSAYSGDSYNGFVSLLPKHSVDAMIVKIIVSFFWISVLSMQTYGFHGLRPESFLSIRRWTIKQPKVYRFQIVLNDIFDLQYMILQQRRLRTFKFQHLKMYENAAIGVI